MLKEDTIIPVNPDISKTLQFFYCLEGNCFYQFGTFHNFERVTAIDKFQTVVIHKSFQSSIFVKKEKRLMLNMICIDEKQYKEWFKDHSGNIKEKFRELFHRTNTRPNYFHTGNHNLRIAMQLKLLHSAENSNEMPRFPVPKRYLLSDPGNTGSRLSKKELEKISGLGEFIKENPEIQHSIKSLYIRSGLQPVKLQEGFKFMFSRTVSDFVRNVCIEKAEQLLKTMGLNIFEVVYSIGFTSRSYFCTIFKRKYYCNPRAYKVKCAKV